METTNYTTVEVSDEVRQKIIAASLDLANRLNDTFINFITENEGIGGKDDDMTLVNSVTNGATKFYASVMIRSMYLFPIEPIEARRRLIENLEREIEMMLKQKEGATH